MWVGLCNQLLLQYSTDVSQTWQTYCGYIEDVHVVFMELESILTELCLLNLVILGSCFALQGREFV